MTEPSNEVGAAPGGVLDVEVSIINHDDLELSTACLVSLPAACGDLRWHATLVDNASPDGSADLLANRFPAITVLRNTGRRGFAANQNDVIGPALRSGTVRYVLALNNDTVLGRNSVVKMVRYADQTARLGAVGPRIVNSDGTWQQSLFRFPTFVRTLLRTLYLIPERVAVTPGSGSERVWLAGSCMLLRCQALRTVGMFDPQFFMFFEDVDLSKRLADAGWDLQVCKAASIIHHNHRTVAKAELSVAMECQLRRSRYLYMEKHYGAVAARTLAETERFALALRAARAELQEWAFNHGPQHHGGTLLRDLGRYDPRQPLPHESAPAAPPIRRSGPR